MEMHMKRIDDKITKSNNQIEKIVSDFVKTSRQSKVRFRSRIHNDRSRIQNPQDKIYSLPKKQELVKILPDINANTRASSKFLETKDKFYNNRKHQESQQQKIQPKINQDSRDQNLQNENFSQAQAKSETHSIFEIDHNQILDYVVNKDPLTPQSQQQQVFDFFEEFSKYFQQPLIKKFKNCIYLCESVFRKNKEQKYKAFIYFYSNKFYYGQIENEQKCGVGVQMCLKEGTIYKGTFQKGHKIGKFTVINGQMIYQGHIHKGKYHGYGRLETPLSVYIGQFNNGKRHGFGQEFFIKSGLTLKGNFTMDCFNNENQRNQVPEKPKSLFVNLKLPGLKKNYQGNRYTKTIEKNEQAQQKYENNISNQQQQNKYAFKQYSFDINDKTKSSNTDLVHYQSEHDRQRLAMNYTLKQSRPKYEKANYEKVTQYANLTISEDDPLPSHFRKRLSAQN